MKFVLQLVAVVGVFYLASPGARAASTLAMSSYPPISDSGKPKLVKFRVRNDLAVPIDIKAGENPISLKAGETIDVKLPVGAQVVTTTAIPGHAAGEVLIQVDTFLDDALIHIKP